MAKEWKWLPTLGVLVLAVTVSLGGFVVAGDLASSVPDADAPVPSGPGIPIGLGASLHPLPGWTEADRFQDPEGVRVSKGVASLDAYALSFTGSPDDLVQDYLVNGLQSQASQLQVTSSESVVLAGGLQGVRISYVGVFGNEAAAIEGEVTAGVTADGLGMVFDGWTQQGQYGFVQGEVRAMVEGVTVGG